MSFAYVCVGCKTAFERPNKLEARFEPRCPACHAQHRRESKRATWHKHGSEFLARRKAKQEATRKPPKAVTNETETVQSRQVVTEPPELPQTAPRGVRHTPGRSVARLLPDGRKIVWMADDLK